MIIAGSFRVFKVEKLNEKSPLKITCSYSYYDPKGQNKKGYQSVIANLWGKDADFYNGKIKKDDDIYLSLKECKVETYSKNDGTIGNSIVGSVIDIKVSVVKEDDSNPW